MPTDPLQAGTSGQAGTLIASTRPQSMLPLAAHASRSPLSATLLSLAQRKIPVFIFLCPTSLLPSCCKLVSLDFERRIRPLARRPRQSDRKSTRLNSSHGYISYAVFCLKKKTKHTTSLLFVNNKHSKNDN